MTEEASSARAGKVEAPFFVPKSKLPGSWDPNAVVYTYHEFFLTSKSWGTKARWEYAPNNQEQPQFTYPAVITEVTPNSEASMQGIKPRDQIIAVKQSDNVFREVKGQKGPSIGSKLYVEPEIAKILMSGGRCMIRVRRPQKALRCTDCNCDSDNLWEDERQGDIICLDCGVVCCSRLMCMASEWRNFKDDDSGRDPNRAGEAENPLLSTEGLSTFIGGAGNAFGPIRNAADAALGSAANLSKTQHRNSNLAHDRSLIDAFKDIQSLCDKLGLNRALVHSAQQMYKRVDDEQKGGKKAGRTTEAIVCSVVFLACQEHGVPRTLKELCSATECTKKDIGKTFKSIQQLIGTKHKPIEASLLLPRFASHLKLPMDVVNLAVHICNAAKDLTAGRVYTSVAGAAIYMAVQLVQGNTNGGAPLPTAKDISDATGAAEATIRQVYREIHPRRHDLVPPPPPSGLYTQVRIDAMPEH